MSELPAGVTCVTPTRRLAHHLRSRHDAACVDAGLRTWRTPDVVTWDDLLRRQFDADRASGRTVARWLDEGHARLAWEQVIRRDRDLSDVLAPAGLGTTVQRSWNLLHEYEIPLDALQDDASPEVRVFARWAAEYRRWLARGAWLDAAEASREVSSPPVGARFQFIGFDRLTPAQSTFLKRATEAGVDIEVRGSGEVTSTPVVVACNDFDSEVETAARWAAHRLQQHPQHRIAIVVPNLGKERGRVRRLLDRVLVPGAAVTGGPAPESTAYELAAARPLIERAVIAAALAWLEACVVEPDLAAISSLLRSRFDAGAAEALARTELDARLRRFEPSTTGLQRVARLAAEHPDCAQTAALIERALARARSWHAAKLPSQWVAEFFSLLRDIGWPGPDPGSTEHQAVQRWQGVLGEYGASDDVCGATRARAALAQLRVLAAETSFEPQEIAAPVLVIDPGTAVGMQFDAVWVCGLEAARWPPPASPDPFLPREWQVRRQVPGADADVAAQLARQAFDRLSRAAPTVVCSVPRFEKEAPLLPSPLTAGLPRLDGPEQWGGPDTAQALFASRPRLESVVDGALPPFAALEVAKGGARLLELQAQCPFRAGVELRLGGRELEDPQQGIPPTERGNLTHAVLQRFWTGQRDAAHLRAMTPQQLAERVSVVAGQVFEPLVAGADDLRLRLLALERRWIEARVVELLEQDRARPEFSVEHVEEDFTVDVGGVQVMLKLDRVDRLKDGSLAVIDYKTGSSASPAAWMSERPELPQLPLYVRAVGDNQVSAIAFGVVRKGATGYLGYAREKDLFPQLQPFDASRKPFKEFSNWEQMLETWRRRLDAIALEHARGDARLAPDPSHACRHCHLPGLCRSGQAADAEEPDDAAV